VISCSPVNTPPRVSRASVERQVHRLDTDEETEEMLHAACRPRSGSATSLLLLDCDADDSMDDDDDVAEESPFVLKRRQTVSEQLRQGHYVPPVRGLLAI
jgi:hypothetical protein